MRAKKFTILSHERKTNGVLYEVFVDDPEGFAEFVEMHGDEAVPGSTVDIADVKAVFRLRHDGNWEKHESYAASEEEAAALDGAAAELIFDELIPDHFVEGDDPDAGGTSE